MSFASIITCFKTGDYTVTRRQEVAAVLGRRQPPIETVLIVPGSEEPVSGAEMQVLPESFHQDRTVKMYTSIELYTTRPGFRADVVTIDGEPYEVYSVQTHRGIDSAPHYESIMSRAQVAA